MNYIIENDYILFILNKINSYVLFDFELYDR